MNGDTNCIPDETSDDIDVPCGVDNDGMNNDTHLGKYSKVCHSDNQRESCQPETEYVLEPIGEDEKTGSENHNISFHNQKVTCVVEKCPRTNLQESTKPYQSFVNQGVTFRPVKELSFIQEADVVNQQETNVVNQQETNTVNQQETNTVNQQETNVVDQQETNVVNQRETNVVNQRETNTVNQRETNTVNQRETNTVRQQETNVFNQQETNVVNQRETDVVNQRETDVVNQQETNVVTKQETNAVNQPETNVVNQRETDVVNQHETNVATHSDKNVLCPKEISNHKHPNTNVEQATGKVWNLNPLTMHNNLEIQGERNQEITDERQKEMGIAATNVISPTSKSSLNHQGILIKKRENNYVRKRHETDKGRRQSSGKRVSSVRAPRRGRSKRIQWVDVEDGASLDEEFSVHQYRSTSTSKTVLYFAIFICLLSLFGNIATMALLSRGTKVCPKGVRLLLQVQTASDIAIIASTLCIVIWIAWDSLRQR